MIAEAPLEDWEARYIADKKAEAERRALDEILQQRIDQAGGRT